MAETSAITFDQTPTLGSVLRAGNSRSTQDPRSLSPLAPVVVVQRPGGLPVRRRNTPSRATSVYQRSAPVTEILARDNDTGVEKERPATSSNRTRARKKSKGQTDIGSNVGTPMQGDTASKTEVARRRRNAKRSKQERTPGVKVRVVKTETKQQRLDPLSRDSVACSTHEQLAPSNRPSDDARMNYWQGPASVSPSLAEVDHDLVRTCEDLGGFDALGSGKPGKSDLQVGSAEVATFDKSKVVPSVTNSGPAQPRSNGNAKCRVNANCRQRGRNSRNFNRSGLASSPVKTLPSTRSNKPTTHPTTPKPTSRPDRVLLKTANTGNDQQHSPHRDTKLKNNFEGKQTEVRDRLGGIPLINHKHPTPNNTITAPASCKALLNRLTNPKQDMLLQAAMSGSARRPGRGSSQARPVYETGRKTSAVDPIKFETEPLPRETRGFQPRSQTTRQIEEPAALSTKAKQSIPDAQPSAEPRYVPEIGTDVNAAGIKDTDRVSRLQNPSVQSTKQSQAEKVPQIKNILQTNQSETSKSPEYRGRVQAPVVNTTAQPTVRPGLEASRWATPKKNDLSSLPGLRGHPEPPSTWDNSNGYTASRGPGYGIDFNTLPKNAWTATIKPGSKSQKGIPASGTTTPNPVIRPSNAASKDTLNSESLVSAKNMKATSAGTITRPQQPDARATPTQTPPAAALPNMDSDTPSTSDQQIPVSSIKCDDTPAQSPKSPLLQSQVKVETAKSGNGQTESTVKEYLPQHLRAAESSTDTNTEQTADQYVPPHLRTPELKDPKVEQTTEHYVPPHLRNPPVHRKTMGSALRNTISAEHRAPSLCSSPVVTSSPLTQSPAVAMPPSTRDTSYSPEFLRASAPTKPALNATGNVLSYGNKETNELVAPLPNLPDKNHGPSEIPAGVEQNASPKGKGKATEERNTASNGNNGFSSASPSPRATGIKQKYPENNGKNGAKGEERHKPTTNGHKQLNWDQTPANHPETWEGRKSQPIPSHQRKEDLKSWTQERELADDGSVFVDTTAPEFTLGTGVVNDASFSSGPSDEEHFTRRLPNDPLTLARAEETAQSKVDAYLASKQGQGEDKKLTKQEKREAREAWRQRQAECAELPNPYKPVADIYIRPAKAKDLIQITDIYNYYIKTSAVALELDPLTRDVWRMRMEDCREEGYDMFVAVQRTGTGNGQVRRNSNEPIFGFAYAEDQNDKRSSCRFAAVVQIYVNWKHYRVGVGRCLLDRVMHMLNVNHHLKKGVDWEGEVPMKQREIKKVMIEIPYWDDHDEEKAIFTLEKNEVTGQMERVAGWKAAFLQSVNFEHVGTIPGLGFKRAILEKGKTVSIAQFMLDTWITISNRPDSH